MAGTLKHPLGRQEVDFRTADGVFIKSISGLKRDDAIPQHVHQWDHTTFVATGGIAVWKDYVFDKIYQAPAAIFVEAGVKHTFLVTTDFTTILCIHRLDNDDVVRVLEEHEITQEDIEALSQHG